MAYVIPSIVQGKCIGGAVLSLLHEKTSSLIGFVLLFMHLNVLLQGNIWFVNFSDARGQELCLFLTQAVSLSLTCPYVHKFAFCFSVMCAIFRDTGEVDLQGSHCGSLFWISCWREQCDRKREIAGRIQWFISFALHFQLLYQFLMDAFLTGFYILGIALHYMQRACSSLLRDGCAEDSQHWKVLECGQAVR
jgi:hypothetical protein